MFWRTFAPMVFRVASEELTTSNDQVKSFKIGVNSDIVPHILDSQSWPKGVIARKFLNQRRRFYNRKK